MQKSLLLILLLALVSGLHAQDKHNKPKVMIIPFDPDMYFSDADESMAKYNNKNVKEVRTLLRAGLNAQMNAKLLSEYQTRPLLNDTAQDAGKDLYAIYKSVRYFKDKAAPGENDPTRNNGGSIKKQLAKKEADGGHGASTLIEVDKDGLHIYMNVKVYDVKMFDYLHNKYGTEVFLFVNQLNIVTEFSQDPDVPAKREVGVHYSIFDYKGKQLAGDVAITSLPSNVRDINTFGKTCFPAIAENIEKGLPGHVKKAPEPSDIGKSK